MAGPPPQGGVGEPRAQGSGHHRSTEANAPPHYESAGQLILAGAQQQAAAPPPPANKNTLFYCVMWESGLFLLAAPMPSAPASGAARVRPSIKNLQACHGSVHSYSRKQVLCRVNTG
ncbi:unnamed protein product [Pleuronectes platessa]|uniref:Uncharacterized protein n=1 Tax=Pleuronectes platessa TaxID=8262 RepID=A0A9N7TKF0_PLEPL|nr:unnamed protein product [Pleuronectes platessa]